MEVIKIEYKGFTLTAGRGWASGEKDGKTAWRAIDVFKEELPTKELLVQLHEFMCRFFNEEEES